MFWQRLLVLVTGAFVSLCLALGLTMMALAPAEKKAQTATAAPGLVAAPSPAPPSAPASAFDLAKSRKEVEGVIAAAPDYAGFFKRMRETFPADYDGALDAYASRLATAGRPESVDYYAAEAVRRLRQARGALAAKSEAEALARVFDMQLAVLRAISREDSKLCVGFLYGGAGGDFQKFAQTRRALVADMAVAGVDAIASGQAKQIERSAPTDADFRQLEAGLLARGLGKPEIDALLDGKAPQPPLDDAKMCAAGQTYLEALRALPEAARLRIYGLALELMAKS